MKFFDSHAHYFDAWFNEYEGGADALLDKFFFQHVGAIVNIATNPENLRECIAQAKKYENMYVSSGTHPEDCLYIDDIDAALAKIEASICNEALRKENKIVAIGEIGFDYHLDDLTDEVKAKQRHVFEAQMQMAQKYGLPVIIHDREAHGDCFETILRYPSVRGVFHSYSGCAEMAHELCRRGWMISFSGVVTFKNSGLAGVLPHIGADRIVLETDAPYLAPVPHRGRRNESAYLPLTAAKVASALGMTTAEVADVTAANSRRLLGF